MKKIILINIIFIFFILFFVEFFFRAFNLANFNGISENLIIKNNNFYKNQENIEAKVFGIKVYTDRYGFRVPYKDFKYTANNFGVLILGDSTSFGVGVNEEKTFVGLLRKKFLDINFFNSSVIGYDLSSYNNFLLKQKKFFSDHKIESIILFLNINDIDFESEIYHNDSKKNLYKYNKDNFHIINILKNNYIVSHLNYFLRERSIFYMWIKGILSKPQERFYAHIYNLYKNENYLSQLNFEILNIKKIIEANNINFTVIILPYEFQIRKKNCNENYLFPQNILKERLSMNNIKFYDYTSFFCDLENSTDFFLKFDPVHLSEFGHNFIFELLKKDIYLK